jgi:hypothetical protein
MSLSNPLPRGVRQSPVYKADGATVTFGVPFWFLDPLDLCVEVIAPGGWPIAIYQNLSGYTVAGAGQTGGGAVIFNAPPVFGALVVIIGLRTPNRTTSVVNGGSVVSSALETELDVIEATCQELRRDISALAQQLQILAAQKQPQGPMRSACLLTLASNITWGLNWLTVVQAAVPIHEADPFNIAWNDGLWPFTAPIWGFVQTALNAALLGGFNAAQLAALQAQCMAAQNVQPTQTIRRGQVWLALSQKASSGVNWLSTYEVGLSALENDPGNMADRDALWPVGGYAFANLQSILAAGLPGGFTPAQLAALQAQAALLP